MLLKANKDVLSQKKNIRQYFNLHFYKVLKFAKVFIIYHSEIKIHVLDIRAHGSQR